MNFLDLFAGIGGFRMGMEMAGHKCVGYVEIDKFARKSYEAIFDTKGEWTAHDIRTVPDDDLRLFRGKVDVICGGFPCQAFSVAGKRLGFEDTRGTLFFEIARFAKEIQPRYLFLENVKGLLSHDKGRTFETILLTLDELGYDAEWQLLNSKDFGVPQNRERVFIIGHLRGASTRKVFPIIGESSEIDCNIVGKLALPGKDQWNRVYATDGLSPTLTTMQGGRQEPKIIEPFNTTTDGNAFAITTRTSQCYLPRHVKKNQATLVKVREVLTPDREDKRQNGRRMKEPGEPMFTLTAQDRHGVAVLRYVRTEYGKQIRKQYEAGEIKEKIGNMRKLEPRTDGLSNTITTVEKDNYLLENYRIRKLTPRECWRLQGFPDWAFDRAAEVNSDSQLYKQAGNSVTVNVIYEIAKRMGFDD
jgi:DNA (cytosine-5)-methyltransferase 1